MTSGVEWHRCDGGAGDVGLDIAGVGLEDGDVVEDGDGLLIAARGEGEIGACGLAQDDGDAAALQVLESGGGDVEGVGAGVEVGEEIIAGGGGDGLLADAGGGLGE